MFNHIFKHMIISADKSTYFFTASINCCPNGICNIVYLCEKVS